MLSAYKNTAYVLLGGALCKAWQLIFSCFSLCALVKRCFLLILIFFNSFGISSNVPIYVPFIYNSYPFSVFTKKLFFLTISSSSKYGACNFKSATGSITIVPDNIIAIKKKNNLILTCFFCSSFNIEEILIFKKLPLKKDSVPLLFNAFVLDIFNNIST